MSRRCGGVADLDRRVVDEPNAELGVPRRSGEEKSLKVTGVVQFAGVPVA